MIKSIIFLCAALIFSCAHKPNHFNSSTKKIKINDFELELNGISESVSGNFILSLTDYETIVKKSDKNTVNELLIFDNSGEVKFSKTIKGVAQPIFVTDFKRYNTQMYSYFVSRLGDYDCNSMLRFLDNNFNELIIYDDINLGLDCHEALSVDQNNIILIYNSFEKFKIPELREFKKDSSVKFIWKLSNHYSNYQKKFDSNRDPFHLNAVSVVSKSKLMINLSELGEILIINYPSGKIVENISAKNWKF
ncbi:MAG: hypothetical protein ABL930_08095, partial [Pseudobdellovibrio sp.]